MPMSDNVIKIVKVRSKSRITLKDIHNSLRQHKVAPQEKCMAVTEAGTRHLFLIDGYWVDSSGQRYA